ncbi:hypothetical protein OG948_19710 [Embleya sp. NBC_00888]|uniref:hypothetical protein n=1 Tax=Embleya sp. NBC_00888 TaxID=2975960 RepID=UPI00386B32C1|nr:hypothetical protein OG948_19710 [Embleya sp. NBC_00888]
MRTSVVAPYAAYLRVYEPLAAFPEPERERWAAYAATQPAGTPASPEAPSPAGLTAQEHRSGLENLLATPPVIAPPHESEDAYVHVLDGVTVICPRQTRLRCWTALAELRREYPAAVLDVFWPRLVIDQAHVEHERWKSAHPDVQPHIHSSTWHVPVRWFVLFAPDERVLVPAAEGAAAGPGELYYRTPMVQARRRVARALKVLRETVEDGALITGLESVGRWLEEFHPRALVELDYGGLVRLLGSGDPAAENSVADVAEGIAALGSGDGARASAAYRRITERWQSVRALEHAS